MKHLKENGTFFHGMAVMLVIALLDGSVSAAAGQVSFNQAGVRLFGESKVTAGESYKASNGQEVPTPFPNEAELGVTHGAFTETAPKTADTSSNPVSTFLKDTRITAEQSGSPTLVYGFHPTAGKHGEFLSTSGPGCDTLDKTGSPRPAEER
ncbi:MAG: hypothetical protein HFG07_02025 [Oscillibacter sp.]|nr:hypothetical protein [Oscillibacter sp.]